MSIFDTISDVASSLFDGNTSGAAAAISNSSGSDWFNLAKGAVLGNSAQLDANQKAQTKEEYLYRFLERNTAMQSVSEEGKFQSHPNKQYGAGKFSVDPGDIQKEWAAYLQGVADPSAIPGKLYKAGGAN